MAVIADSFMASGRLKFLQSKVNQISRGTARGVGASKSPSHEELICHHKVPFTPRKKRAYHFYVSPLTSVISLVAAVICSGITTTLGRCFMILVQATGSVPTTRPSSSEETHPPTPRSHIFDPTSAQSLFQPFGLPYIALSISFPDLITSPISNIHTFYSAGKECRLARKRRLESVFLSVFFLCVSSPGSLGQT